MKRLKIFDYSGKAMPSKFKLLLSLTIIIFINSFSFTSIISKQVEPLSIPSYRFFSENTEFTKGLHYKKITVAEYVTDPIIMYASLWGCLGLTYPLYMGNDDFAFVQSGDAFAGRMKMEPFASGRINPVTTTITDSNGNIITVLKNDFYAKNRIEPIYFTELTLYLRSKNYHPALIIGEIFSLAFMYEFTIRPFFMPANFEQLIKNPIIGLVSGILIDELSTFLLSTPYIGLHVLAYILNPFNALPVSRVHPLLIFSIFQKEASISGIIKL
jgi:hypothetical protein